MYFIFYINKQDYQCLNEKKCKVLNLPTCEVRKACFIHFYTCNSSDNLFTQHVKNNKRTLTLLYNIFIIFDLGSNL